MCPLKLNKEVEIWYIDLVGIPLIPLGSSNFSALSHLLTALKMKFSGHFFLFFEFIPRMCLPKLNEEVEIWYIYLVEVPNKPLGSFNFSALSHHLTDPENVVFFSVFLIFSVGPMSSQI